MDDQTAGRALRAPRRRRGWRQVDLSAAAGVSQTMVSRAERGAFEEMAFGTVRSLFAALDAGCNLAPWWRSGQLDRLLDEDHATLVARTIEFLRRHGWKVDLEVTFAYYSDRGSIDILATRRADGAVLVVEVKTQLMSVEEMLRTLDRKVRVAARVVMDREGWRPRTVSRLVIFADDTTNRRRLARAVALETALPLRAARPAAWLDAPVGAGAGAAFLPLSRGATGRRRSPAPQRVRRARPCSASGARPATGTRNRAEESPHDYPVPDGVNDAVSSRLAMI